MKKALLSIVLISVASLLCNAQANKEIKRYGCTLVRSGFANANKTLASTNEKGQTSFTITEKGSYSFTLTQPTTNQTGNAQAKPGNGVKAVKVSLGKNPPGAIVAAGTTNTKGEIEFKDLEPGKYFIVVGDVAVICPYCGTAVDHTDAVNHQKNCTSKPKESPKG